MIAPLAPFAVKGTLWYQGEADAGEWQAYTELLPTMIGAWRTAWGQPSFYFLIVQIANYTPPQPNAIEFNSCADIRDVQRKALSIPETGLAVALDTGNTDNYDGHPRNKQDVGLRLAIWALNKTYGRGDVVPSGPLYRSIKTEKDRVVVAFDYVGGGLTVRGSSLDGFAIAGPDKMFYKARAEIKGDTVVVWSDKVSEPSAVRYAWATNPSSTLYNKEGLPASSFRTDDWAAAKCAP
jgi:sialate O-acetylesterase